MKEIYLRENVFDDDSEDVVRLCALLGKELFFGGISIGII